MADVLPQSKVKHWKHHLVACDGKDCRKSAGAKPSKIIKKALKEKGLQQDVLLSKTNCLGNCSRGANCVIHPAGEWYERLKRDDLRDLVERCIAQNGALDQKRSQRRTIFLDT